MPVKGRLALIALLLGGAALFVVARQSSPPRLSAPASTTRAIAPDALQPLRKVMNSALDAYNGDDTNAFLACFAKSAHPPATEANYQAVFNGIYRPEFGKYLLGSIIPAETVPDPKYGQLVYDANFEKRTHVKVSADLIQEAGALKIVQLRFEKMQPAPLKQAKP